MNPAELLALGRLSRRKPPANERLIKEMPAGTRHMRYRPPRSEAKWRHGYGRRYW